MPLSSEMLRVGQRLEVGIALADGQLHWLPSRLEDQHGELSITVAWPTDRDRRLIPVAPGAELQLAASTCDALYSATAVVQLASTDGLPLLHLQIRGGWERSQRRNAVRTAIAVRPRVAVAVYGEHRRAVRLGLTNISATGVQVRCQDELRRGDLLDLAFELMGIEEEIQLQARVRRVHRLERVWDAGCEFEGIAERLAQRIVQFIFAQQRATARARRG